MGEEVKDVVEVLSSLLCRIESLEFKIEEMEDKISGLESLYLMDGAFDEAAY